MPKDVPTGRAISIRQPHIEQILRGKKIYEYRSRPTKIRGRVFLYASKSHVDVEDCRHLRLNPDELPVGVIVGSVEITGCKEFDNGSYGYRLKNPKRYRTHRKPRNRPQPCWFFPFGKKE